MYSTHSFGTTKDVYCSALLFRFNSVSWSLFPSSSWLLQLLLDEHTGHYWIIVTLMHSLVYFQDFCYHKQCWAKLLKKFRKYFKKKCITFVTGVVRLHTKEMKLLCQSCLRMMATPLPIFRYFVQNYFLSAFFLCIFQHNFPVCVFSSSAVSDSLWPRCL